MSAAEKVVYCQIDAHLDTNPKIRRAGRDARDIFEFVLRRVAIMRADGCLPIKYVDTWYLADQLMMSEDEARSGLGRAIEVKLLEIDESANMVRVPGWSEEWGRRPLSTGERQQRFRDKHPKSKSRVTESNGESRSVTESNESNAYRGEEKRGEEKSPDQRDTTLATILILEILKNNPRHKLGRQTPAEKTKTLNKWADYVRLMREVDGHSEEEIRAVIRWCQADSFWRGNILSTSKLREKWDQLVAQMSRGGSRLPVPKPIEQPTLTFRIGDIEVER